jgi:hypothetical protein
MNASTESGEPRMMDGIDGSSFSMSAWKLYGDHPRAPASS